MSAIRPVVSLGGIVAALCFASAGTMAADEVTGVSGYLGTEVYEKLEEVETRDGRKAKRWIGPKLSFANYKKVLIKDVTFFPEPVPNEQVSMETLYAVKGYLTENLRKRFAEVLNVTDEPGPEILSIQVAITGVEVKTEGMKAYEIVPVAAIFGGIKAMTGKRDRDVIVFAETAISDSVTGEMVGAGVRRLEGEHLKGKKEQLQLQHMQEGLDSAIEGAQGLMSETLEEK